MAKAVEANRDASLRVRRRNRLMSMGRLRNLMPNERTNPFSRRKRARAARVFVRYVYVAVCIQKASSADASLRDAVHTGFDVRGLVLPPFDL